MKDQPIYEAVEQELDPEIEEFWAAISANCGGTVTVINSL